MLLNTRVVLLPHSKVLVHNKESKSVFANESMIRNCSCGLHI